MRRLLVLILLSLAATSCSPDVDTSGLAPLPETTPDDLQELLASSDQPVLLNVWASWCIPCRSEAPLLEAAHEVFGSQVRFIGLNVRDEQEEAVEFLAEFDLDRFEHYFDRTGAAQGSLGSGGVPLTFFFLPGGELVELHFGVIDERTMALNLDEIIRLGGS